MLRRLFLVFGSWEVNMETLKELKAIIANAPKKATHVDFNGNYWHNSTAFYWLCCDNGSTTSNAEIGNHIRKLSDIERVIELVEIVEDAAALGFLTPSFDSGVSHKALCKKYEALK